MFEFLNGTLVNMLPDVLNIETIKMFKKSCKLFKAEVLKTSIFKRWNETVFQNFCDTYRLPKILFKNVSVLTHFALCAF